MLEEGYAAVTTRRLTAKVGVNSALVYYYFDTMDGLFIELFRRSADRTYARQEEALASPQPLWALWELIHDPAGTALTMEFAALANHRKAIRSEIAASARRFRMLQLERLTAVLEGYGLADKHLPPISVILMLSGLSRFLLMEEAFDLDIGHAETIAVIERFIRDCEGERVRDDATAEPHRV